LAIFGKDLGEFSNNDDVTYIQLYLQLEGAGEADSLLAG
jgi:hypothetical protein